MPIDSQPPLKKAAEQPFDPKNPAENLILCDCNETIYDGSDRNYTLLTMLVEAQKLRYDVQLFSDDPSGSQQALKSHCLRLRKQGLIELADFLDKSEVIRKDFFDGEPAFIVIDNDHSTHKVAVTDEFKFAPNGPRLLKMIAYVDTAREMPRGDKLRPKN